MSGGRKGGGEGTSWRIEERADDPGRPGGVLVYDVYRGKRRVAWGLKDRAAAERWISRLGGATPADAKPSAGRVAPPRVWWGDHGDQG